MGGIDGRDRSAFRVFARHRQKQGKTIMKLWKTLLACLRIGEWSTRQRSRVSSVCPSTSTSGAAPCSLRRSARRTSGVAKTLRCSLGICCASASKRPSRRSDSRSAHRSEEFSWLRSAKPPCGTRSFVGASSRSSRPSTTAHAAAATNVAHRSASILALLAVGDRRRAIQIRSAFGGSDGRARRSLSRSTRGL